MKKKFIPLHCHSYYSYQDGLNSPKEFIELAKDLNIPAIGLTDHRNAAGWFEFYETSKNSGIKPIYGVEFNIITKKEQENLGTHLTVWAKNKIGYYNILKLIYKSNIEYFYSKPRVLLDDILDNNIGLIVGSGCLHAYNLYKENPNILNILRDKFKDDFYVEIMHHNMLKEQMDFNNFLIDYSEKNNMQLLLTTDIHNIGLPLELNDVMASSRLHKPINEMDHKAIDTLKFTGFDDIFRRLEQFDSKKIEEAANNTFKLVDSVEFDYNKDIDFDNKLPTHYSNGLEIIKERIKNNIKNKVLNFNNEYSERLKYELNIVKQKGFVDYFLLVSDMIEFAKNNDIAVGDARGSVGGSLLAYLLDITSIDPIKYKLVFERFLSISKSKLPDIDIDFCSLNRKKILKYLKDNFKGVCQIVGKSVYKPRSALKTVVRAYEGSAGYAKVNSITKNIPSSGLNKKEYINMLMEKAPEWEKYIKLAAELLDRKSYRTVHAAGIVLSPYSLDKSIPIRKFSNTIISDFDKVELQNLGFLKLDILGLSTVTHIDKTIKLVEKNIGRKINIDIEDNKIYKDFIEHNNNIFQFDSSGMTNMIELIKPKNINDVALINALYRPGALSQQVHKKVAIYRNEDKIVIPKAIAHVVEKSNKIRKLFNVTTTPYQFVYQEDFLYFLNELGFNFAEADIIRRHFDIVTAVKEKKDSIKKIHKALKDYEPSLTLSELDAITSFLYKCSGYLFNLAHALGYSMLAVKQMWLKYYYPLEFYATYLNCYDEKKQKKAIKEAVDYNIKVLPPDINNICDEYIIIENSKIQAPLIIIKHVSKNSIKKLKNNLENSKIKNKKLDFWDFLEISDKVNAQAVKHILYSNQFGLNSKALIKIFDEFRDNKITIEELKKKYNLNKLNKQNFVDKKAYDPNYFRTGITKKEKDKMKLLIADYSSKGECAVKNISDIRKIAWVPLFIYGYREVRDKKNNKMAFISVLDHDENKYDIPIFSSNYNIEKKDILNNNKIVMGHVGEGGRGPIIWDIKEN